MGNCCSNDENENVTSIPEEKKTEEVERKRKPRVRVKVNPDGSVATDQIPTVQLSLPTAKPIIDQEKPTDNDLRDLHHLTPKRHGPSTYVSTDQYALAPKIPRYYIAPMSEEDWNKNADKDTLTIVESSTTDQNGPGGRPWYK